MTLEQACEKYGIELDRKWGSFHMLVNPLYGQVNALDHTRGKLIAISDKGLGLIISVLDKTIIGHKDWFIEDAHQADPNQRAANRSKNATATDVRLQEFRPSNEWTTAPI